MVTFWKQTITIRLQIVCEKINNVHNLFKKDLQFVHSFRDCAQNFSFSGKKFVEIDETIFLDIFPKVWYTEISTLQPPGRPAAGRSRLL